MCTLSSEVLTDHVIWRVRFPSNFALLATCHTMHSLRGQCVLQSPNNISGQHDSTEGFWTSTKALSFSEFSMRGRFRGGAIPPLTTSWMRSFGTNGNRVLSLDLANNFLQSAHALDTLQGVRKLCLSGNELIHGNPFPPCIVSSVECLVVSHCSMHTLEQWPLFPKLRSLDLRSSMHLHRLGELSRKVRLLQKIDLSFTLVETLDALGGLPYLHTIRAVGCRTLVHANAVRGLPCLHTLSLLRSNLARIGEGEPLKLVRVFGAPETMLREVGPLPRVQSLELSKATPNCERDARGLLYLHPLGPMEELHSIHAVGCKMVFWDHPSALQLRYVNLSRCNMDRVRFLSNCPHLREIRIDDSLLTSLDGLQSCRQLECLSCKFAWRLECVAALSDMPVLRKLSLESCGVLGSIDCIAGCQALENLCISGCIGIRSIEVLSRLSNLRELRMCNICIDDDSQGALLRPLAEAHELRVLDVSNTAARRIRHVSTRSLEYIYINNTLVDRGEIDRFVDGFLGMGRNVPMIRAMYCDDLGTDDLRSLEDGLGLSYG